MSRYESSKKLLSPVWGHLSESIVERASGSFIYTTCGTRHPPILRRFDHFFHCTPLHGSIAVPSGSPPPPVHKRLPGKKLLDFSTGIGVVNTGHCHPRVVAAAQEQVGKLIHGQVKISCV